MNRFSTIACLCGIPCGKPRRRSAEHEKLAGVPGLRRLPHTSVEQGVFTASGDLSGVRPGRHPVRILTVRRVSGTDALKPLEAFDEIFQLQLEHIDHVDLAPLGRMPSLRELVI
jgi:hypothetical protein